MTTTSEPRPRFLRNLALLLIPALISAMTVFLLWQRHPELDYWLQLLDRGRTLLEENPWALIAALATLPGMGFPITPVILLFGVVLVPRYGIPSTLALAIAAQGLCTVWTYALAAGPLRGLLTRYILRHRELPDMSEGNALRLCLILRLTPGIPYAIQNIVLGILGMPFRLYLLVSIPTTSIWTAGYVITGGAIFEGQIGWAITGVIVIIVLILATRMWNRKNVKNAE
ncbi:VTT domain-containing protein [Coraliomargarita sp. SDUM461004]|uniref:VTT domain-containing protein n=1 Tax=Thalassobacterium sedimentorum TaxID=3041258 RepID=A0ABU1AIK8_9BACT|nr:VTT domain-containing protein [Coraliomargarita sp. SDUM461004]MDQ8194611.1 VTT domain-containing protein [Coraliomargarita sp. SDUM461004]